MRGATTRQRMTASQSAGSTASRPLQGRLGSGPRTESLAAPATVGCALSGHEATQQAATGRVKAAGARLAGPQKSASAEPPGGQATAPRTADESRAPPCQTAAAPSARGQELGATNPLRASGGRGRPQRRRAASHSRCDGSTTRSCLDERRAIERVRPGREPLIKSRGYVGLERSCTDRNRTVKTAENVSISKLGNQVVPRKEVE